MKRLAVHIAVLALGLLGVARSTSAQQCIAPTAGLVGWWSGDGHALDLAGTANGTLVGGATFAQGLNGQAFSLDGMDDYVSLADSTVWDLASNDFTIGLWVRMAQIKNSMFLQQLDGSSAGGFQLYFYQPGVLAFANNSTHNGILTDWFPQPDTWYYVAVTRSSGTYRLWVDGLQLGNDQFDPNPVANVTGPVRVGSYSGGGFDVQGLIDELELHHRALSAAELQTRWLAAGTGMCKDQLPSIELIGLPGVDDAAGNNNQLLDSGETVSLSIRLRNVGLTALTHASAVLSTNTPGVSVPQAMSDYPDLAVNLTVANSTPFAVAVSPSFEPGTTIPFRLDVITDQAMRSIPVSILVQPTEGLVGWWPGDGDALDLVGANHGTLVGGATFAPGVKGQGFSLDGVNDYVSLPDSPVWDLAAKDFTIALWARMDQIKNSMFVQQLAGSTAGGFQFYFFPPGSLAFANNSTHNGILTSWFPQPSTWYYLVVTRSSGTYRLWVDGLQLGNDQFDPNPVANVTGPVRVGSYSGGGFDVQGRIDELELYHRALSATEIHSRWLTITADTSSPVVSVPSPIAAQALSLSGTVVTFVATASDNVDGPLPAACNPPSGSMFLPGATTVTCTATDSAGNTGSGLFIVTVSIVDHTPPVLMLPNDQTQEATSSAGAAADFVASALDAIDGPVLISCSPSSGTTLALGTTPVTCGAVDQAGNASAATFTIAVVDTTPPSLTVGDMTTIARDSAGVTVDFAPTSHDLVSGNGSPVCSPTSGSTFSIGVHTVSCMATDAAGNSATATFRLTVLDGVAPVVTPPADQTSEATSSAGATVAFVATASDNIDEVLTVACIPASESPFALGNTPVTCTATDAANNTGAASFTVTVKDTTKPNLVVPAIVTATVTSGTSTAVSYTVSATDLVDGGITPVCHPVSGSAFPIGTTSVSCTATDAHGNVAAASFAVRVNDGAEPIVTVAPAGDRLVEATSTAGAIVTFSVSAMDNYDASLAATCTPNSGAAFALGETAVTCAATDASGNTGRRTFIVRVVDTAGPVLSLPGPLSTTAYQIAGVGVPFNVTAMDAVNGTVAATCTPASGATFPPGISTVLCTASDARGNASSGTFTVNVTLAENRIGRFVAFSRDHTALRPSATVVTGDVGANQRRFHAHTGVDDDGDLDDVTVRVGQKATMQQTSSRVVGDTILMLSQSSVQNTIDNALINRNGVVLGSVARPMAIPYLTLPAFPAVTPGTTAITVAKNQRLTLGAGVYGRVQISQGAVLVLTGGLYQMLALDVDKQATVVFHGATEIRIKADLATGAKTKLILDQTVPGLRASQMVIYVEGGDIGQAAGDPDDDGDNAGPVSVHIGQQNVVQANIYASNGTLWLKSKTQATGSFIALHVRIGESVTLTLDSAFK